MRLYCILFCFDTRICPYLQFYFKYSGPRELSADAEVAQIIAMAVLLIKGCASQIIVQQLICLQAELSLDILFCCRFIFAVQFYGIYTNGFQFLSQLGMHTNASKGWAVAMISMESAMISRDTSEKCMPS